MSVASDIRPVVYIPPSARSRTLQLASTGVISTPRLITQSPYPVAPAAAAFGAEVIDLDRWRHHSSAPAAVAAMPIRLTRRGVAVAVSLCVLSAIVLVMMAMLSAPAGAAARNSDSAPAQVVVQSGDSLWSIAGRVAPTRDPRVEMDELRQINHLSDDTLRPGQALRTR